MKCHHAKLLFLITLISTTLSQVQAGGFICESTQNGVWSNASTWKDCNDTIPNDGSFVTIKSGHVISLDTDTAAINSIVVEVGGDFNVADNTIGSSFTLLGNANTGETFDLSNASIVLNENFTIDASAKDIVLGAIDGAFNLTLNSNYETKFEGMIGRTTALNSLITDASGSTVFANEDGGVNDPNVKVSQLMLLNDPVLLAAHTNFQGNTGSTIFNSTLDSETNSNGITFGGAASSIVSFNGDIGSNNPLSAFRFTNSIGSTIELNLSVVVTTGLQIYTTNLVLNSPSNLVSLISNNSSLIKIGSSTTYVRSLNANEDALLIDTDGTITVNAIIGDNNQQLSNLTLDSTSISTIKADSIEVSGSQVYSGPISMGTDSVLTAGIIDIHSTVDNGGFSLTFDTSDTNELTTIAGAISGTGDIIKVGSGGISFNSINTFTGDLLLQQGDVNNLNISDAIFPAVGIISIADGVDAKLGGSASSIFELANTQTLIGDGVLRANLEAKNGSTISPGFSTGSLSTSNLIMDTGSTLVIELNGTVASSGYDQIASSTGVNLDSDSLGGATLDLNLGFVPDANDTFTLIKLSGPSSISGTFNGLPEGGTLSANGILFSISYIGGDSNDVVLTALGSSIIRVDQNTGPGGNGESWENAFNNLQDALAVASMGMEIWVADGAYYPDDSTGPNPQDETSTFTLINGVSLYGGFEGTETELSQRDPSTNITILSGDIDGDDLNGDGNNIAESVADIQGGNAYHVVDGRTVDISSIIDGFTITSGNANGGKGDALGGGITCEEAFSGPSINQILFIGNMALSSGGASNGCTNDVQNSSYFNNQSVNSRGGAISTSGGNFTNVVFEGNQSNFDGGALSISTQSTSIKQTIFRNNNSKSGNGGALSTSSGNLLLNDVLFLGNHAGIDGGAIYIDDSMAVVFTNITATGNNATVLGGGIRTEGTGSFDIVNSIVWNNQDSTGTTTSSSAISSSNAVNNSYSLIQGFGTTGTSNLDEDPEFIVIADPSTAPNIIGNPRLQSTSMAIDTGDNSLTTSTIDLNGRDRIFNSAIDMGAYEYFEEQVFKDGFE